MRLNMVVLTPSASLVGDRKENKEYSRRTNSCMTTFNLSPVCVPLTNITVRGSSTSFGSRASRARFDRAFLGFLGEIRSVTLRKHGVCAVHSSQHDRLEKRLERVMPIEGTIACIDCTRQESRLVIVSCTVIFERVHLNHQRRVAALHQKLPSHVGLSLPTDCRSLSPLPSSSRILRGSSNPLEPIHQNSMVYMSDPDTSVLADEAG